jgi:serine/threonine protein kinase
MAEVYLARRRAAGVEKWLVVKRMRPERAGDARFLDLFVREARLSMSLAHQNIVPVFDFGRIDDQVFLAMERVEGKDLGSSLARVKAAMPPLLAAFVAAECCQALDYAHRRKGPDGAALGIVHRDVTPRNVLLSWSGEVKLTDFGIAALAGEDTGRLIGTPAYMAPEQARGEPIDSRADVYALGLVLREAVTGERARSGSDRDTIVAAARKAELPAWPDGAPDELVAIADRATSPLPGDRYPDARSMLEDLDAFIVARRAAAKADSPARQLASWLATVWGDDRELGDSDDSTPEGAHLVSFLDDGALDVIGTGTERSLLATAAEVDEPAGQSAPKLDAATSGRLDAATSGKLDAATSARLDAATSGRLDAATSARLGASAGSTTKLRAAAPTNRWIAVGAAMVAIAIAAYVAWPRHDDPISAHVGSASTGMVTPGTGATIDHAVGSTDGSNHTSTMVGSASDGSDHTGAMVGSAADGADHTAAAVGPATDGPNHSTAVGPASGGSNHTGATIAASGGSNHTAAAVDGSNNTGSTTAGGSNNTGSTTAGGSNQTGSTTDDHSAAGSATHRTPPDRTNVAVERHPPAGSGSGSAAKHDALPVERHKVTINSQPWSYFTVDDDPASHQTVDQVMLAPGPHRIHFTNPQLHLEREITINVADHDVSHVEKLE